MKFDIVRAWKDENYRQSLSDEQLCSLPANPVGEVELPEVDLEAVTGGDHDHGEEGISLIEVALGDLTSFNILSSALVQSCAHTSVSTATLP